MEQTIESRVASAILEKKVGSIEIEGNVYEIAPPSIATLILISELVSTLPIVENVAKDKIVYSVLHHAKNFKALGDIAAILILGAKNIRQEVEITKEKRILGLFPKRSTIKVIVDKQAELSQLILENISPSVLFDIIVKRLNDMEVSHFFAITTSLSEANILKPTKEVEKS